MYLSGAIHNLISVTTSSRLVYRIKVARSADRPRATASDKRYLSHKIRALPTALQKKILGTETSILYLSTWTLAARNLFHSSTMQSWSILIIGPFVRLLRRGQEVQRTTHVW